MTLSQRAGFLNPVFSPISKRVLFWFGLVFARQRGRRLARQSQQVTQAAGVTTCGGVQGA